MNPRVILVEPPRADVDVSPAERYGTILPLFGPIRRGPGRWSPSTHAAAHPRPSVVEAEPFSRALLARLREVGYDPDADFFCVTGGTLQCTLAMAAIVAAYGRCRLLVYSANTSGYAVKEWSRDGVLATKGDTACQVSQPCTTGPRRAYTS